MRRAISAAVASGLVLGGVAAMPAVAAERGHSAAKAVARVTALKTVVYDGYELRVPASWPVYRLDEHPATCVRYDIDAVYLGTPGANMNCPAGLIGRGQTVSVIPSTVVAAGLGSEVTYQRQQPDGTGGTELRALRDVASAVTQDAGTHELRVVLDAAAPATVVATYGASSAVVARVLASVRLAPRGARVTPQSGSEQALSVPSAERLATARQSAGSSATAKQAGADQAGADQAGADQAGTTQAGDASSAGSVSASWKGLPANWPVQVVQQPSPAPVGPRLGFDTCTAPSLNTMSVWRQKYSVVGVYIGGVNYACAFGNLSATWVRTAAGMGWGMLPIYVGRQAPCWGYQGVTISPKHAVAQGRAAGADAVADARLFGLTRGSPIYYDMEAYNSSGWKTCVPAVLLYLGAWDRTVAAAGYLTGVYSSQDSGIDDMAKAKAGKTKGFTPPDAIWFALWDNIASLSDGSLPWPVTDRDKQYAGNVRVTVGKIKMFIDRDLAGGPLAR